MDFFDFDFFLISTGGCCGNGSISISSEICCCGEKLFLLNLLNPEEWEWEGGSFLGDSSGGGGGASGGSSPHIDARRVLVVGFIEDKLSKLEVRFFISSFVVVVM